MVAAAGPRDRRGTLSGAITVRDVQRLVDDRQAIAQCLLVDGQRRRDMQAMGDDERLRLMESVLPERERNGCSGA